MIFKYEGIPVSVNALYFNRGGRRIMTAEARKFKNHFVTTRGGMTGAEFMSYKIPTDTALVLELWFFLHQDRIYNKGFGKSRSVKYRFRKLDVSNLVKLAEDSVADLLQIKDQNNWSTIAHKRVSPTDSEYMVVKITPLDLENDPYQCPIRVS